MPTPPDGPNGLWCIKLGVRVKVTNAWRGFNSRFIGRIGYVVERLPPGVSFDYVVKFPARSRKAIPTLEGVLSAGGSSASFRFSELGHPDEEYISPKKRARAILPMKPLRKERIKVKKRKFSGRRRGKK